MSLTEIAVRAGVSIATVSRVLNRSAGVRPRTAELVWQTVREMEKGVTPATGDAGFVSGRTGAIALAFLGGGSFEHLKPVYLNLVGGIGEELRRLGLRMQLCEIGSVNDVDRHLHRDQIDGVLSLVHHQAWSTDDIRSLAARIPMVWLMGIQDGPAVVDHVAPRNFAVGELAYSYLQSRPCKRICYAFVPVFSRRLGRVQMTRAMGFSLSARANKVAPTMYVAGDASSAGELVAPDVKYVPTIEALVKELSQDGPVGVFVSTDQEAAILYPMLYAHGLQPGIDVIVISCDNEMPTMLPLKPRPATIDIHIREIGRQGVRQLLRRIHHPDEPPIHIEINPTLALGDAPVERKLSARAPQKRKENVPC